MGIVNFIDNEKYAGQLLMDEMVRFFNEKTLVINDTRGMILPSVLPHIEFVGTYDQRVLSVLQNTNIIFSEPFSEEIKRYYEQFDMISGVNIFIIPNNKDYTLARNILQNESILQELKQKQFEKIIPFFVNDDMHKLSQCLGVPLSVSFDIFQKANDKLLLKKFLQQAGLPTIDGVFSADLNILKTYFETSERYLLKDPLGVSGYGFWDNTEYSFQTFQESYGGQELIIEKFIEKESSPSVQFFISQGSENAIIFGVTDQILENGKIYIGNTSPSRYIDTDIMKEILRQSEMIITYIQQLGYTGFAGIDFIVDVGGNVYATEVNARFTGATYPALVAFRCKKTLFSAWETYNYEGSTQNISEFLSTIAIQKQIESGIFPIGISGLELFGKANLLKFK